MTSEEASGALDLAGLSIDEAVETTVAADETRDRERVRSALADVSEDGVVTTDALEDTISHTAKVVATPETRVELAEMALDDAREAADPVADLGVVATRLAAYEDRLETVQRRVDDVAADLESVVDGPVDGVYESVRALQEVTADANRATEAADALKLDVEEFEHWLTSPDKRLTDLEADATDLEESLDGLEARIEVFEGTSDETAASPTERRGGDWAAARIRHRTLELLLDDIRAELSTIRTWHEREDVDRAQKVSSLSERLDSLSTRLNDVDQHLAGVGPETWRDQFGDALAAFEDDLANLDTPVDWATVEKIVDTHRTAVESRLESTETTA